MGRVKQLLTFLSIYALCLSRVAADAQCNEADRKALLKLKAGITQDPTGVLTTWRGPDCCNRNWNGVDCDVNTGKVTRIDLPSWGAWNTSNYMVGTLSKSIGDLNELVYIRLTAWKRITGKIPNSIARLLHLDTLVLSQNDFIGKIPSWIPGLSKLRILRLGGNRLRGHILPAITTMSNLNTLELGENHITGTIPPAMGNLSQLVSLTLNNNLLYGFLPDSIGSMKTLFELDVSHNALVGSIPSSYGNLSRLIFLSLNNNKLAYAIPSSLGRLSSLMAMFLQDNQLTGSILASLGNISGFNQMDLSRNYLEGPIPTSFSLWINPLTTFKVSGNRLTNPLPSLAFLPSLLDLSYNEFKLGISIPSWITNSNGVILFEQFQDVEINLAGCGIDMRLEDWKPLSAQFFTSVDLSSNNISGSGVEFFESMTSLSHANLSNNRLSYDFSRGVNYPRQLQTLDLHSNQIYGSIPSSIGTLTDLNTLDLSKNGLTGKIPADMLNLRNLMQLNVSYNHLCGEIPQGKPLNEFPVSSYSKNKCLCGLPLGHCQ